MVSCCSAGILDVIAPVASSRSKSKQLRLVIRTDLVGLDTAPVAPCLQLSTMAQIIWLYSSTVSGHSIDLAFSRSRAFNRVVAFVEVMSDIVS